MANGSGVGLKSRKATLGTDLVLVLVKALQAFEDPKIDAVNKDALIAMLWGADMVVLHYESSYNGERMPCSLAHRHGSGPEAEG